jgi:PKD repeat protein
MSNPSRVTVLIVVLILSAVLPSSPAAAAGELTVFAGQDKTWCVNREYDINDAQIITPSPLDPEKSYSFSWDFDDRVDSDLDGIKYNDGESNEQYTSWVYHKAGTYTITLTVFDGTDVARDTLIVTVHEDLPPILQVEPYQMAPYGIPYQLDVVAEDDVDPVEDLRWEWVLGDGQTSMEPSPLNHTYGRLGEMNVTVFVFDRGGNEASFRFIVEVVDVTKPRCDAGPDVTIMVNGTVYFDGTGSSDDVGITSWSWQFMYGDLAVMISGPTSDQTFYRPGTYVVGLQVQDAAGNTASDTMTVTVRSPGGGDDGEEDPEVFEPRWEYNVWRSLVLVVIVVVAFAVSSVTNSVRERGMESHKDQDIFFRVRPSP